MIDFIKGMGTFLKNPKPSAGTQKIGELVDEAAFIDDETEVSGPPLLDIPVEIGDDFYEAGQNWQEEQIPHESHVNQFNKPIEQDLTVVEETDEMLIEKIANEIFLNQDFMNNICIHVANILTEKITSAENTFNAGEYKDRMNKFIEKLNPVILNELENFMLEECIVGKAG
ncbi:MAG: hypothetical protein K0R14_224 [Burkholderiales bacterium]|jgi:hypothetical protein|nr:hypothetical protein [Burkholderiales bacterium]